MPITGDLDDTALTENWLDAKASLDAAKAEERELRDELFNRIAGDLIGSETKLVGPFELVFARALNFTLDEAALCQYEEELTPQESSCVVYKPKLDARKYKKLPFGTALSLHCVIVKPATPTIKLLGEEQ